MFKISRMLFLSIALVSVSFAGSSMAARTAVPSAQRFNPNNITLDEIAARSPCRPSSPAIDELFKTAEMAP